MINWLLDKLGINQKLDNLMGHLANLDLKIHKQERCIISLQNEISLLNQYLKMDIDIGQRGECTVILTGIYRNQPYINFYDMDVDEFTEYVNMFSNHKRRNLIRSIDKPRFMPKVRFEM